MSHTAEVFWPGNGSIRFFWPDATFDLSANCLTSPKTTVNVVALAADEDGCCIVCRRPFDHFYCRDVSARSVEENILKKDKVPPPQWLWHQTIIDTLASHWREAAC